MTGVEVPETQYANSGDLSIAYQVLGDGPMDVVYVSGFISHQELAWEMPFQLPIHRMSAFARLNDDVIDLIEEFLTGHRGRAEWTILEATK
jgi:hypothetical protein